MAPNNLLFVEGKNDLHVFYALLQHHQIPEAFSIIDKEGIDNLLNALPVELKRSDLDRLGIVVDANTHIEQRWDALCHILSAAGNVDIPSHPDPNGTVVKVEQPERTLKVGIWLMPNNQRHGMLEDFIRFLVPAHDRLWAQANDCLQRITPQDRRFPPAHLTKAHLHTWLAWQEQPGTPIGLAITKRYLDPDARGAHQLMGWIRRLFDLDA